MNSRIAANIKRRAQREAIKRNRRKLMPKRRVDIFPFINGLVMAIMCMQVLIPIFIMLIKSVNVDFNVSWKEFLKNPHISWKAYSVVLERDVIQTGLKVSVLRVIVGTITGLFGSSLLAFILSRKEFVFRKQLTIFMLVGMLVQPGLIPEVWVYNFLHLRNTFAVYIVPRMVNTFYVFVLREYMKNIPESYIESAKIEGYGYFGIYTRVISPMCRPIYAAVALFLTSMHWNEWFDSMLYNRMEFKFTTMAYETMKILSNVVSHHCAFSCKEGAGIYVPAAVRFSSCILMAVPTAFIYPFFQKYFIYTAMPGKARKRENVEAVQGKVDISAGEQKRSELSNRINKWIGKWTNKWIRKKTKKVVFAVLVVLVVPFILYAVVTGISSKQSVDQSQSLKAQQLEIVPSDGLVYRDELNGETVYRLVPFDSTNSNASPTVHEYEKEKLNKILKYSVNDLVERFKSYVENNEDIFGDRNGDVAEYYLGYDVNTKTLVYVFLLDKDIRVEYEAETGEVYRILYKRARHPRKFVY
mgnify:CR=1 FL=1